MGQRNPLKKHYKTSLLIRVIAECFISVMYHRIVLNLNEDGLMMGFLLPSFPTFLRHMEDCVNLHYTGDTP